jgi:DNA polymerase-3 subunit alpha
MGACAMTDHGNMFGAIEFYLKARRRNQGHHRLGSLCRIEGMQSRGPRAEQRRREHLVLLAATNQGYRNLMQLVSRGSLEGFYYKPRWTSPCSGNFPTASSP